MAFFIVPTFTDTDDYDETVDLDGVKYVLAFQYNARNDSWYMSISDRSENLIVAGIRLVTAVSLLGRARDSRLPPGVIFMMDTTNAGIDAGFADIGQRVLLIYSGLDA